MPTIREALSPEAAGIPAWLRDAGCLDSAAIHNFLDSRTVFYPGSGNDGHAIAAFGGAHAAYCFVHADYMVSAEEIRGQLAPAHAHHIRGYQPLVTRILTPRDFSQYLPLNLDRHFAGDVPPQSVLWAVLERSPGFGDEHGPERLAFMHFHAEAVWTYANLWGALGRHPPFGILLQDHGFGGNWAAFGGENSPLHRVARQTGLPRWLLVAQNTTAWPGYLPVSDAEPGGMHRDPRRLWRSTV